MKKTSRINEIMGAMQSFGKDKYRKSELLSEMFALQHEMVELTFNGVHASIADLRIWDVERHFEQMNQNCGNVADDELQIFKDGSKKLCNLIKAEISGTRGEAKAFRTLEILKNKNLILKNVELSDHEHRTELDAVVIMPEAIVVVEVKNTAKNIFIDENGDYFRTGEYLCWDCNIVKKMQTKEELLRKVLECRGIQNFQIKSVVAFTDTHIEVHNQSPFIRTCFVNQLAYIIDGFKGGYSMTDDEMQQAESAINAAENKESYPFEFDVTQYKRDFATLMATLEEAASVKELSDHEEADLEDEDTNAWLLFKNFVRSKRVRHAGRIAAAAALTIVFTATVKSIKKGGVFK